MASGRLLRSLLAGHNTYPGLKWLDSTLRLRTPRRFRSPPAAPPVSPKTLTLQYPPLEHAPATTCTPHSARDFLLRLHHTRRTQVS